jgi:hypothetical protein
MRPYREGRQVIGWAIKWYGNGVPDGHDYYHGGLDEPWHPQRKLWTLPQAQEIVYGWDEAGCVGAKIMRVTRKTR